MNIEKTNAAERVTVSNAIYPTVSDLERIDRILWDIIEDYFTDENPLSKNQALSVSDLLRTLEENLSYIIEKLHFATGDIGGKAIAEMQELSQIAECEQLHRRVDDLAASAPPEKRVALESKRKAALRLPDAEAIKELRTLIGGGV